MPFKKVFESSVPGPFAGKSLTEGLVEVRFEDGRQAMIVEIGSPEVEETMFVRLHSWDETKVHADASQLLGQRVRVTVEIVE